MILENHQNNIQGVIIWQVLHCGTDQITRIEDF